MGSVEIYYIILED